MEDCRSKIHGKENILFDLPSPHPVLGGGNDTNDVIIAAACAHLQVLIQDILSKTIERKIWRKVRWGTFGQRAVETGMTAFLLSSRHFECTNT